MLGEDDLETFRELGYAVVKGAFAPETAARCADLVWDAFEREQGMRLQDSSTWPAVKCSLAQSFGPDCGPPWSEVFTPRLTGAIADICGGEDSTLPFGCGWWMCTFPPLDAGAQDECTDDDWRVEGAWHVDGHWFTHYPFSAEVGLVAVMLFSDVEPNGGGTAVAERSHIDVLQTLCSFGLDGSRNTALARATLQAGHRYDVVELTGRAGDVVLLHPLLLHARSSNLSRPSLGGAPWRLIAHPSIGLRQPLDLGGPGPANAEPATAHAESARTSARSSVLASVAREAVLALGPELGPEMLRLITPERVRAHALAKALALNEPQAEAAVEAAAELPGASAMRQEHASELYAGHHSLCHVRFQDPLPAAPAPKTEPEPEPGPEPGDDSKQDAAGSGSAAPLPAWEEERRRREREMDSLVGFHAFKVQRR